MSSNTIVGQRILNCIPSRETENDWIVPHAAAAGLVMAGAIPPAMDLREEWWPIGNQGDTGACVGWAAADGVARWHMVKEGRIERERMLSPRFIWMAAKENDEFVQRPTTFIESAGTSLKASLDVLRHFGAATVDMLPVDPCTLYAGREEIFYASCSRFRIACYFNLKLDLHEWRRWIAENGPILARVEVDLTWDTARETAGLLDQHVPLTRRGGHAVAIVGYTPERFIIRNSWGEQWGDRGFAYASDAYVAGAFTEAYGIAV